MLTQENLAGTIARMSIHQRIKQLRDSKGLSMEALAKLVGVSAWQTIQQWEKEGGTAPKRDRLEAVAAALGTTASYLLFGDQTPAPALGMTVGATIKKLRKKLDLTQQQLAQKTGVHVGTISAIERGEDPKGHLPTIAQALGTDAAALVGEDQSANDPAVLTRLKDACRDLPIQGVAHAAGVAIETVEAWYRLDTKPLFTLAEAAKLQESHRINSAWLMSGKGDPRVPDQPVTSDSAPVIGHSYDPMPVSGWRPIPVVGNAQLGDNGHFVDLEYPVGHGDGFVDFPTRDPDAYALRCVGDSMKPRIQDGEFVVIEPSQAYMPGDDVLIKSTDGRVMIKRFLYKRNGRTHVVSVNEAHAPMAFDDDQIEKIHFMRAICRPSAWRPSL